MNNLKISEIMRISGLSLDDIKKRFAGSDIIIESEEQSVSIDDYKKAMGHKSSKTISLKSKKLKLSPKKSADSKKISDPKITSKTKTVSLIKESTQEELDQLKGEKRSNKPEPKVTETKAEQPPKQVETAPEAVPEETAELMEPMTDKTKVNLPQSLTVSELSETLGVEQTKLLKTLFDLGIMAGINHVLDFDTAGVIADELGFEAIEEIEKSETGKNIALDDHYEGEMASRAPVVTIMGHVDHGKTSLLDKIRSSKITEKEAGGITQHIGAYQITTDKGPITFLDTPGHEAFTSMRARGANVTDIVILVVSSEDGVMPQTIEAIQHAKAANAPIIVAITKIDKPDADIEGIKSKLAQHEVLLEEWGGEVQCQPLSSHTGEGIDALLDAILLQAEMLELTARKDGPAVGMVIETRLDKGTGPVATILVQHGQLKQSDAILVGDYSGKVRRMNNDLGQSIKQAGAATPVEIIGLSGLPGAGDHAKVMKNEKVAKAASEELVLKSRQDRISKKPITSLEDLFSQEDTEKKTLHLVLKTDVTGSLEALEQAITKLSTEDVDVKIAATGVGGINESDAQLARASHAVIIGFNVRADSSAKRVIEAHQIPIHYFSIIYDLIKHIKQTVRGIAGPKYDEQIIGLAEVRDVFRSSRYGAIAGCMVTEGTVKRNTPVRVLRNNVVIYEGKLESLRRMKNDVPEVRNGTECGIGIKDYNDIKPLDQIEAYVHKEILVEEDD